MEEKKKPLWMQVVIFIVAMGMCFGIYFGMRFFIVETNRKGGVRVKDDFKSCFYQIELASESNNSNKIGFKGIYFKLNQDTPSLKEKAKASILLINIDDPKDVHSFSFTQRVERKDVEGYFKCEYSYLYSGFVTETKNLDLQGKTYEILLKENQLEKPSIETGLFLLDGKIISYNPVSFQKPKVSGTKLEKIITEGTLMAYRPELDLWIYQHGWKIYWIAGPKFVFEDDGSTYIHFRMDTTQVDRLPADQVARGVNWSNIGDDFEKNEVTELMEVEGYRISVRDIPTEYSVTHIWTGYNVDSWIWLIDFRPVLE